jgi:hypothetical protein
MGSMQCNVEFEYQLSICSGTKENHGKPWSSSPVAGPSECKLTYSQQSGIKSANPNINPQSVLLWFSLVFFSPQVIFYNYVYVHMIWISTKKKKTKLHGLSPRANYTDRATAACRRSDCQLVRIGSLRPYSWFSRQEPLLFYQVAPPPHSRPIIFFLVLPGIETVPPDL